MLRPHRLPTVLALAILALIPALASAQSADISEEIRTLQTYPFSEPNPVPILNRDPRLYPYHSFEGYSATSEPREWKVVKLENDWIEVFVLPEVGGKVWGAVVKETGHEFIYRNEVMKFRNISLRGPWTSGGIEFNFGVIGHTPATATPVDYVLRENDDGSVSCFVGGMDLPSRTHWRVEVRLPADRAYFETNVLWYNPTPLEQPYYNWMTAAAFAQDDLEMSIPGDAYLEHSGRERTWPDDAEGRYLPLYRNNTFAGHKSYHVVGELNDFFGGYYLDDDYGFGHWARYEDMPGQKLWLWALSREGGVWEDLLTDTDGQYVEFQAGRLFVQYSPGDHVNPITQVGFDPVSASRWTETWFPLEGIGGLSDASRDGALHISREEGLLTVDVNAFREVTDTLKVWADDDLVSATALNMEPLDRAHQAVDIGDAERFRVQVAGLELDYDSDPAARRLSRPFTTDPDATAQRPEADKLVFQARELMKGRQHADARTLFDAALAAEPWNRQALLGLAELAYRGGSYQAGLTMVNRVLQLDAYDAQANFLAGSLYRALGQAADARDAFGWATRAVAYRSAAYAQLAEIMVAQSDLDEAARYARLAIDFDRHSVPGWRVLAMIGRKTGNSVLAEGARQELLSIDPLHHFARTEAYLGTPDAASEAALVGSLGGEFPDQTLLEMVTAYVGLGQTDDALTLLDLDTGAASGPLHRAWRAYLMDDASLLAEPDELDFVFPFRRESLSVLAWAADNHPHWRWTYLLALNLWAVDRVDEARELLHALADRPDHAPFYVARAQLPGPPGAAAPEADLRRAVSLDPDTRTLHVTLIRHLQDRSQWNESLAALDAARARFPDDFNLALLATRSLLRMERADEAVEILANTQVLPSENARESHLLYAQAHTLVAMNAMEAGEDVLAGAHLGAALEWPESLGQGRPYEPEERLVRYLQGRVAAREGRAAAAETAYQAVLDGTPGLSEADPALGPGRLDVLAVPALAALARTDDLEAVAAADLAAVGDAGRYAAGLARAFLNGAEDTSTAARALARDFPLLFNDFEGAMILRALIGR
jgi:tetratricopeptide (TPR) repeat protein